MTVPDAPSPDLWRFSLAVYARPDVAPLCLALQDGHGADVNLLLWAAWLALVHGHTLTPGDLAAAEAAVAPWREGVVRPLRAVRRTLKAPEPPLPAGAGALRERIKAAELEAERLQQQVLDGLPETRRPGGDPAAALAANLSLLVPPDTLAAVTRALHTAAQDSGILRGSVPSP
ncbi:TIGR02444 family protein [Rhodocista pekingensis]|uniref:TIGR02444 family protein n=1 Tax=Rhodocista pekingensis TaxID=201185 RepID=A0ABW2KWJ6_9PROT